MASGSRCIPSQLREWGLPNHCLGLKPSPVEGTYGVKVYLEQLPNPQSRVTLSDEKDALHVPLARVDWRLSDVDHALLREFVDRIRVLMGRCGELSVQADCYDMEFLGDASHQMGTTRMACEPKRAWWTATAKSLGSRICSWRGARCFPPAAMRIRRSPFWPLHAG